MDDQTAKMLKGTMNHNLEIEPENIIMLSFDSVHAVDTAKQKLKEGD